ncbi:facilitated trehalose transporter Tret1-2 homolog [Cimex lectularius]|uniref:Major facilitator superfamily (MFS) profile domain-containing protein n=1 Tax=Cimex lectularius TaxID=79782 RepID=A0A8I6RUW8_CIMLE|nr:facilitated trehalose transporter Tret1-2 homolog [Cimex lectularius]
MDKPVTYYQSEETSAMEEKLTESIGNVEIRQFSSGPRLREKAKKKTGQFQQYLAAVVVCLMAFILGTVIGWTAPVLLTLQSDESPVGKMTDEETSWLGSQMFLGGIVGTLFWGRIADGFGRKAAGYSVAAIFILGWGLIIVATKSALLYVARFLSGLSGSGALILCPLYVSEIAQDSIRGALGSCTILFMNGGIVTAYVVGAATDFTVFTAVCLAVPILFAVLFFFLPETPSYLFGKGWADEAEASLLWFRGGDHDSVQDEMGKFSRNGKTRENTTYRMLVADRGRRRAMVIGLGLFTWQQFCGILALLTFTTTIFAASGSSLGASKATITVGLFQLFGSCVSSVIVDRSGRRILLLISYTFMGVSLSLLSLYFYALSVKFDVSRFNWLPVICLSVHVVAYALGAGPVPYVVMSDTLAPEIRGLATSVIILWGMIFSFMSVQIFPFLVTTIGSHGSFLFFAGFCFVGVVFTWALVPETKGVPLEQVLARLNRKPAIRTSVEV